MSKYEWYDLYKLLADKLFELYENYENTKNSELKDNYEKGNEYFFRFFNSSENKYFGEIIYAMCANEEKFFSLFNWAKNISEMSLDPFHIFVSFNNSGTGLENKIERLQFYFDIFNIDIKVNKHQIDNRSSVPHITPVKLLTNRTKKTQNDIWIFFSSIVKNDEIGIKKAFIEYKNWYGIAFTVITEFLFWINSSIYISLDKNTQKLLIKLDVINKIPNNYAEYISLIKKNKSFDKNIFRLIVQYSSTLKLPSNKNEKEQLLDFLYGTNERNRKKNSYNKDLELKFQLIALKVIKNENFNKKIIKNLKLDTLYKFNQNFEFVSDTEIYYKKENEINLYDLSKNKININVVVGKNGTGKSTLLELALIIVNNLLIIKLNSEQNKLEIVKNIYAELYFMTDSLYKIVLANNSINVEKYNQGKNTNEKIIYFVKEVNYNDDSFNINKLFYTQHLNYSLHSLNSNYFGEFLNALFHKTDEYKTPILIEPQRTEGNININRQLELMKDRLLDYVLTNEQMNLKKLVNNKAVKNIKLNIEYEKLLYVNPISFNVIEYNNLINMIKNTFTINFDLEITENISLPNKDDFNFYQYTDERTRLDDLEKNCAGYNIEIYFLHYIINKLKKMCEKDLFAQYTSFTGNDDILESFLNAIKKDKTYKTKKIKRAIYSLVFIKVLKYNVNNNFDVIEFAQLIENEILSKYKENNLRLDDLIPPSFFKVNLVFENQGTFESLSSGEKQKIFIIYTILYHLKNINDENNFNYINIVLDEIELYFHPEMQKDFIFDLLKVINESSELNDLDFNFTFITHSPFILSDSINNNLLKLDIDNDRKSIPKYDNKKIFAGNIYDLLNDSFFMDSFIGKFAEDKINRIINVINKKEKISDKEALSYLKIINNIGEPLLRNKLEDEIKNLSEVKDDISIIVEKLKNKSYQEIKKEVEEFSYDKRTQILELLFGNQND